MGTRAIYEWAERETGSTPEAEEIGVPKVNVWILLMATAEGQSESGHWVTKKNVKFMYVKTDFQRGIRLAGSCASIRDHVRKSFLINIYFNIDFAK